MQKNSDYDVYWRLLGLAVRARKVITGTDAVELNLRRGRGSLLIITEDMAAGGAEKLMRQADGKSIRYMVFGNREELGHWTGKENRVVALVMDEGFARRLLELSDQQSLQKNAEAEI